MCKLKPKHIQPFKKLSFTLLCLFLLVFYYGCTKDAPDAEQKDSFIKYFGGPFQNTANGFVKINDNFYILGTISESGKTHIEVIKTDEYGNSIWKKELTDANNSITGSQIIATKDNNSIALLGTRTSDSDSLYTDFYFAKIDLQGEILIEKTYPFQYIQNAQSIIELDNGGFLLAGTSATATDISGKHQLSFTVKINGDMTRTPVAKGSASESINKLLKINNDTLILGVGSTSSNYLYGSPQLLVYNDQQGTSPSPITYPEIHGIFNDIVQLSDNEFIVCGTRYTNSSHTDGFIALIKKSTFELSNFVPFENNENSQSNSLIFAASGDIIVAGSKINTEGNYDLLLMHLSKDGIINEERTFGYKDNEYGVSLIETSDSRVVALGTFNYETNGMIALLKFKMN